MSPLLDSRTDAERHFKVLLYVSPRYPSFLYTPIDAIRGCLSGITEADCKSYQDMDEYESTRSLFQTAPVGSSGVIFHETLEEAQGWLSINQMVQHLVALGSECQKKTKGT